ncbi:hypothetical protein LTS08_000171 [Lithohypha guttulata]|uniref:PIG-P domain-containing protein n=1 Tax=Lithohypha guttulata TaxID=1690604 RepID=A0AAN7SXU8_9EURO|nr:hypothetical protein LTR51_007204 [Lithohypha guttulata]KAK5084393.1 hypothetical protein LTR05_005469 [Lithohypha guttulata]KAK5106055.1 hypothetical protein LTS08_000171 [Lithohypha guttulata]
MADHNGHSRDVPDRDRNSQNVARSSATSRPFLNSPSAPLAVPPKDQSQLSENVVEEPTPTRTSFALGHSDRDDEEPDDDEEFESHYSRHSSPASSSASTEDDEPEEGDELGLDPVQRVSSMPATVNHHGLHRSIHSTTSLSSMPPPIPRPLYPPFYNKPPTPLPPSPSLTSLLRPPSLLNRSTASTRPTSPDSSDVDETPNDTEAQVAQQARRASPVPPTAPKVPTYEYYGFVLYLASSLAFVMYILWAYLPSPFLHALGITYYPDRWWALAIPAWIVMLLIYIYVALACYNVEYLTLGLERVETMVDEAGSVAILDINGRIRKGGSKRYVAELEERKRREMMMQTWERRKKGGTGSGRSSKRKAKKEREKNEVDEWYGYTGQITETGVASGLSWRQIWNEGTDAVLDVPLGGVCEVLYGDGRDVL